MTQIKTYNFDETQILHAVVDTSFPGYVWLLFLNTLKKVSASNPLQVYFNIEEDENFVKAFLYSSYLYCALDDSTLIGRRYSITNPLTTTTDFTKPVGINEAPVDVVVGTLGVFFLIPGNLSGTNAKIVKMSTVGIYDQTIDLPTVTNAKSITVDNLNDLWIVTSDSPSKYIRVFLSGTWQFQKFS
jgi:hypothetical protein